MSLCSSTLNMVNVVNCGFSFKQTTPRLPCKTRCRIYLLYKHILSFSFEEQTTINIRVFIVQDVIEGDLLLPEAVGPAMSSCHGDLVIKREALKCPAISMTNEESSQDKELCFPVPYLILVKCTNEDSKQFMCTSDTMYLARWLSTGLTLNIRLRRCIGIATAFKDCIYQYHLYGFVNIRIFWNNTRQKKVFLTFNEINCPIFYTTFFFCQHISIVWWSSCSFFLFSYHVFTIDIYFVANL